MSIVFNIHADTQNAAGSTVSTLPVLNVNPAFTFILPQQICGFVSLKNCSTEECRVNAEVCEYINPVFGDLNNISKSSYGNDLNSFFVDFTIGIANLNLQLTWVLQKANKQGVYVDLINLTRVYGTLYLLGSVPGHPSYCGFTINWGAVLLRQGQGCYRVKANIIESETTTQFIQTTFLMPSNPIHFTNVLTLSCDDGTNQSYSVTGQTLFANDICNILNTSSYALLKGMKFSAAIYNGRYEVIVCKAPIATYLFEMGANLEFWTKESTTNITSTSSLTGCLISEPFKLMPFDCNSANYTVKFESNLTGIIGDKRIDYLLYDLTGFMLYDSIRLYGFFGDEKATYKEINLQWGRPQLGLIQKVRDEMISQFEFRCERPMPKYIHDRLKSYGVMANQLWVSDYNTFNADYEIKQMLVVKNGEYSPTYFEDKGSRYLIAKMNFNKGVQSSIKTDCTTT